MGKYGLPTFPIAQGMDVGERSLGELEWLLSHGYFLSSPLAFYLKIRKREDGYTLLSCKSWNEMGQNVISMWVISSLTSVIIAHFIGQISPLSFRDLH
jgi:hypothetical protein